MKHAALILVFATPAFASGFLFEGGAGGDFFAPAPLAETAIGAHIDIGKKRGAIEVRTRGALVITSVAAGATATVDYVTPMIRVGVFGLTFGLGAGGAYFSGCARGDFCGRFGIVAELTSRFVFTPREFAQLYAGVNVTNTFLFGGDPRPWLTGALVIGCLFDFHRAVRVQR